MAAYEKCNFRCNYITTDFDKTHLDCLILREPRVLDDDGYCTKHIFSYDPKVPRFHTIDECMKFHDSTLLHGNLDLSGLVTLRKD